MTTATAAATATQLDTTGLLEPQKQHSKKLLDSLYTNGVSVDLSETGTGKTYTACWIAKQYNSPVVIVCPKPVIPSWKKVLNLFNIRANVIINFEKLVRGNTQYLTFNNKRDDGPNDYTINFPKNSLVIVDECHKCKSWKSKNSDFLIALKNHDYRILLISATAATNPLEMKAFGYATHLHNLKNYYEFLDGGGAYRNRFGGLNIDTENKKTVQFMAGVHNTLFNEYNVASRMTRKQFGNIFPHNRITAEAHDMGNNSAKIQKTYELMQKELDALDERSKTYSQHHFAIMMKYRRHAELLKVPTMVEYIEDCYDDHISPVIFVNFNDSVEAIARLLQKNNKYNNKVGYIVGGQTDRRRQQDIDDFQADKKRIMIANLAAGGVGVSLHDLNGKFARGSLISPSWSAINMLQSLGRIHRAEAKTPTIQKILFAANTIEERVCQRVQSKLNNIEALNDGDLSFDIKIA